MPGKLGIPFLTLAIFNNFFSHESKRYNSLQNERFRKQKINRQKPQVDFFLRLLIFKLQQEVSNFIDICVS